MIKIVGTGMLGADDAVDQNQFDMNPRLVAEVARKNADVIVRIKTAHWRQPNFTSVERALEAAKLANLPIMVDFDAGIQASGHKPKNNRSRKLHDPWNRMLSSITDRR